MLFTGFKVHTGRACCCVDTCLYHRLEVQRLQAAEKDAAALRTREGKLQTALAEKNLENLELRWRLAAAREATNPSLAQVGRPPPKAFQHLSVVIIRPCLLWPGQLRRGQGLADIPLACGRMGLGSALPAKQKSHCKRHLLQGLGIAVPAAVV